MGWIYSRGHVCRPTGVPVLHQFGGTSMRKDISSTRYLTTIITSTTNIPTTFTSHIAGTTRTNDLDAEGRHSRYGTQRGLHGRRDHAGGARAQGAAPRGARGAFAPRSRRAPSQDGRRPCCHLQG